MKSPPPKGMTFVCAACDSPQDEVIARFCVDCKRSYGAGYECPCGFEDVDPPGREWGHKPHANENSCAVDNPASSRSALTTNTPSPLSERTK